MQAVGDQLIDSVVSQNIPILTTEEKYNETVTSAVERVAAALTGAPLSIRKGSGFRVLPMPMGL